MEDEIKLEIYEKVKNNLNTGNIILRLEELEKDSYGKVGNGEILVRIKKLGEKMNIYEKIVNLKLSEKILILEKEIYNFL